MDQRVSLITLGVDNLARASAFYEALGWRGQEVDETIFFQAGGLAVVLWSREKLASDAGLATGASGGEGIVLALNVRSREDVDEIIAAAAAAGASTTPARETFYGGYAGYFHDPDHHAWEIAHNPGFPLADNGDLIVPDFSA
jgi:predicted lactoylglutathione lyase